MGAQCRTVKWAVTAERDAALQHGLYPLRQLANNNEDI